jgi:hypothetical protein
VGKSSLPSAAGTAPFVPTAALPRCGTNTVPFVAPFEVMIDRAEAGFVHAPLTTGVFFSGPVAGLIVDKGGKSVDWRFTGAEAEATMAVFVPVVADG